MSPVTGAILLQVILSVCLSTRLCVVLCWCLSIYGPCCMKVKVKVNVDLYSALSWTHL